ncbi:MAG: hypothetical protein H6Q13_1643 [Bacteroidetes bacterium]|nr:hypothetical protein [Bacteroidota bacterium]
MLLIHKKGDISPYLESKISTGWQSDGQKEFQRQAELCRSKYVVVRSVKTRHKSSVKHIQNSDSKSNITSFRY